MANYSFLLSFNLITKLLQRDQYPSKNTILEYLKDNDIKISERTLFRHLNRIKADFGLDIKFSNINDGYYIDYKESHFNNSLFNVLEHISLTNMLTNDLSSNKQKLAYISFDDSRDFKGIEYLKPILLAIQNNQQIRFTHYNFQKETHKTHVIFPLILKEYANRWYVVGVINQTDIRVYGIDRISNLKMDEVSTLNRDDFENQLSKFQHTIGVSYGEGEPEKIVCHVDEILVKYLRSLPLHHSQEISPTREPGKYRIEYVLYPNREFKYQVLSFATKLDIIEPLHLKEEIKDMLNEALDRYK